MKKVKYNIWKVTNYLSRFTFIMRNFWRFLVIPVLLVVPFGIPILITIVIVWQIALPLLIDIIIEMYFIYTTRHLRKIMIVNKFVKSKRSKWS